jgi:creatinine amidohydrolase/Fe(II)-dependent formamide hydrolase-like protein
MMRTWRQWAAAACGSRREGKLEIALVVKALDSEFWQRFCKRCQLPGIYRVIDWHRATREMWRTTDRGGDWDTNFIHADEAETSVGLLMFPEMVQMK